MDREEGYYWLRSSEGWIIGKWEWGYWTLCGANENIYLDKHFYEIDPSPIKREK